MKLPRFFGVASFSLIFPLMSSWLWSHAPLVSIREEGNYRYIQSNGIPDHEPGQFPNAGNPNTISEQDYLFRVPLQPHRNRNITEPGHNLFGVALNGVPFDPETAEFWNNDPHSGWNYEALSGKINLGLDASHAHVQPNGAYHYHGIPLQFLKRNRPAERIGYAADGFPIYYDARVKSSYQLRQGIRPSGPGGRYDGTFVEDYEFVQGAGDLDLCNGRLEKTPDHPGGIYHYYLTDTFPFVPRCLQGSPDTSFQKQRPPHGGSTGSGGRNDPRMSGMHRPHKPGGKPPEEAIHACAASQEGSACRFQAPHGTVTGICRSVQGVTACVP